jgi:Cu(I)/Ag(I) efflux system membrane protein CusA/SilA
MISRIIEYSVRNRFVILILAGVLTALGVWAVYNIRLDAIPDLSDVQVIIVTDYPGQSPQVVDDQVTYPLSSAMLSVPGATAVRGFSMFELSFVYVLFKDGTDIYWARSRVLEYLNFVRDRLPAGVDPKLGPDATGVGWIYQYVLYPGHYCESHPNGLWLDREKDRWYARQEDAPAKRRGHLERIRSFDEPGVCPLDHTPLKRANKDLAELRSIQDWYLRYPLTAVEGVSEVASIGGFVKQYQVVLDPAKLLAYRLPLRDVKTAIERSNNDVGGGVIEQSENEYMIRSRGYVRGLADLARVPVGLGPGGTPVLLDDIATLEVGGESRRGVGEWNGRGEAVGGIIVSRFGVNANRTIREVKAKLAELEEGLPPGVSIKPTYDRSALIHRSVRTLTDAVIQELVVVALICIVFLGQVASSLIAIITIPIGLLVSILVMQLLGINANIMSLGGLALAIGVMVDSGIVMIENGQKHLQWEIERVARGAAPHPRAEVILEAAREVGPSLFFSMLIITVSFLPIFVLGEQSGRLFKPLAYTKTFAIAAGAILGVTIVPVLMVYMMRGRIVREERNPLNRVSERAYDYFFHRVMRHPIRTLAVVVILGATTFFPITRIGSEFMPPLDEGDLLYMPTTDPSVSITKSKELLQQTDKLIKSFPEVVSVHGKIGRAETATDPAPLSMLETVVQLQDKHRWREREVGHFFGGWPKWLQWPLAHTFWRTHRRITTDELIFGWQDPDGSHQPGLNDVVSFPGIANAWPFPIENRINMLSTGIKTPVGIKIMGPDLDVLSDLAEKCAVAIRSVPGTVSAYPERTTGGIYLDIDVRRADAARYGLTVGDVQDVVISAMGGMNVTTTVEGLERYPVNVRYARELRDNVPALEQTLVATPTGAQIPMGQVADFVISPGAPMIRSENAQRTAWVFVDMTGRDLGGYVKEARRVVEEAVPMPPGYSREWSGRFEYLASANARLRLVIPITLAIIVLLLYISNRSWFRVGVILLAVPFSLIGAFWLMHALGYNMSLAVWVGIIALLGVDAETGQVMLLYLDTSFERRRREGRMKSANDLFAAIHEGAVKRLRPKSMTVATDLIGLFPLMWATGTGADITRRLVAPLIGGITISFLMELLVYPVIFLLHKRWQLRREWREETQAQSRRLT